ncbi:MAG: hypothetical protein M5Z89_21010, partial [Olivibacter sp.]|nr:hypothetical protein [Olivibacter sp. UJ_SKK_5.1]
TFSTEVFAEKLTTKISINSSLVAGTRISDLGSDFYVTVVYDTMTSSIVGVLVRDISNVQYSVVSYNNNVGYDARSGSLFSAEFYVTFYHHGFGQNVTLGFNGLFNHMAVG